MEGGQEAYLLSDREGLPEVHEARPAANQPPISTRLWSPRIAVASTSLLGKFSDTGLLQNRSFVQAIPLEELRGICSFLTHPVISHILAWIAKPQFPCNGRLRSLVQHVLLLVDGIDTQGQPMFRCSPQ